MKSTACRGCHCVRETHASLHALRARSNTMTAQLTPRGLITSGPYEGGEQGSLAAFTSQTNQGGKRKDPGLHLHKA